MKLVTGLGNSGEQYAHTRHNVGFMVLDRMAKLQQIDFKPQNRLQAAVALSSVANEQVLFIKPLTLMNLSGQAVKAVVNYYKIPKQSLRESLYLVHDELDLPLGRLKIQRNLSAAGHHGVESVINALGTQDFFRFRVGVQATACNITTPKKAKDYLLSEFTKEEMGIIEPVVGRTAEAVVYALENGAAALIRGEF